MAIRSAEKARNAREANWNRRKAKSEEGSDRRVLPLLQRLDVEVVLRDVEAVRLHLPVSVRRAAGLVGARGDGDAGERLHLRVVEPALRYCGLLLYAVRAGEGAATTIKRMRRGSTASWRNSSRW